MPLFVRRLHDQDRSGWWASLLGLPVLAMTALYLLPDDMKGSPSNASVYSGAIQGHFIGSTPAAWLLLGIFLFSIPAIIIMNLLPGTIGPNRYGDDPRQPAAPQAIFPAL